MEEKDLQVLYGKIDELKDFIVSEITPLKINAAGQEARLKGIEDRTGELYRVIRGHNGTPGLIAQLDRMNQCLKDFTSQHEKNDIRRDEQETEKVKDAVTWPWVRDKLAQPVAIAFLLWFLLDILPELLRAQP